MVETHAGGTVVPRLGLVEAAAQAFLADLEGVGVEDLRLRAVLVEAVELEQRREHVVREAHRAVDDARVEIEVRV